MSSLVRVLDKCHKDELEELAKMLSVRPDQGLHDLSRAIDRRLRERGGHAVLNMVTGPPSYEEVLGDLCKALQQDPFGDAELLEERLVNEVLRRSYETMSPEAKAVADSLGPLDRLRSAATAAARLGGVGVMSILARPLIPVMMWKVLGPDQDRLLKVVLQVAALRQAVRHRVTVGVVGSPSSGKDSAIKAIFGIDTGNIHPVAGSTTTVNVMQVPDRPALFLVNTPGMGDVVEKVTEEARQVLAHIDVYLYVLNTEGGVQARELADYQACLKTRKPVLVCLNKVDVLRPKDKDRYIEDARKKLGGGRVELVPCAFDPLPQLSPVPIGLDEVRTWLDRELAELGKDPLWPKEN